MSRFNLAERALSVMEQFIHENNLLSMYPDDFQVHDRELIATMPEWGRFLWMVDETSTYLFPIGLHQSVHDAAIKALECHCYSPSLRLCWVYPGSEHPIEETDLADVRSVLLNQACYERRGISVIAPASNACGSSTECGLLAIRYEFSAEDSRWTGSYSYAAQPGVRDSLSEGAADVFARYEVSNEKGLWTRVIHQDNTALREYQAFKPALAAA